MRILFHIASLNIGGAERQLTYLAKGLTARGWEVHVVTLYPGGKFWKELEILNCCTLHSLARKNRWDFSVVPKLVRYIRENLIDVVQGWMLPCNSLAAMAAAMAKVPMLMAIRASNMDYPLGGRLYAHADQWAARWLARQVIFNSYAGRDYYLRQGYPPAKCCVIPNGLILPLDQSFSKPFKHEPPWRVGMIARLDPMKDHVTMFKALAILQGKGVPVELHIYGDGKEDWKNYIKMRLNAWVLDHKCIGMGLLTMSGMC